MRRRRHHNTKGERQIRTGKTEWQVRKIVQRLLHDHSRSKKAKVADGKALTQR